MRWVLHSEVYRWGGRSRACGQEVATGHTIPLYLASFRAHHPLGTVGVVGTECIGRRSVHWPFLHAECTAVGVCLAQWVRDSRCRQWNSFAHGRSVLSGRMCTGAIWYVARVLASGVLSVSVSETCQHPAGLPVLFVTYRVVAVQQLTASQPASQV